MAVGAAGFALPGSVRVRVGGFGLLGSVRVRVGGIGLPGNVRVGAGRVTIGLVRRAACVPGSRAQVPPCPVQPVVPSTKAARAHLVSVFVGRLAGVAGSLTRRAVPIDGLVRVR
ncbi:hypothetical protein GCM10027203_15920 [Nonomuraea fastidiosa]